MKIRPLTPEWLVKAGSLIDRTFSPSRSELRRFDQLHANNRPLHEWVCIHRDSVIAVITFSRAFHGKEVCGLHLAPLAVQPQMQGQGIGLAGSTGNSTGAHLHFEIRHLNNPVNPFDYLP